MKLMLSEIAELTGGQKIGEDRSVTAFSIDTRTLQPGQMYIAIKGPHFDGNTFIQTAEEAGAKAALIQPGGKANIPHIIVENSRLALAQIAGAWRRKQTVQVVGITGSNGKTTVKEMVAAILSQAGSTLFTQGNLNNEIGVPLTLLRIQDTHRYAVIEMGANHPGEIAYTSHYAQADVVILNNAGGAHLEGFGSLDGVAKAKGEIIATLKPNGTAVINRDDPYYAYWKEIAGTKKTLSFGIDKQADVRATQIHAQINNHQFQTTFTLHTPQGEKPIRIQLAGEHNVKNALAASTAALTLGLSLNEIAQGLSNVRPVTGRLQALAGKLGNIIIDDTYNANPDSLKAGLEVLAKCPGRAWLVLGMFGELGNESAQIHRTLAKQIKTSGVERVFATGDDSIHTVEAFGEGANHYPSQQALISALQNQMTGKETILIKGSRTQRMEQVVSALVENFRI